MIDPSTGGALEVYRELNQLQKHTVNYVKDSDSHILNYEALLDGSNIIYKSKELENTCRRGTKKEQHKRNNIVKYPSTQVSFD